MVSKRAYYIWRRRCLYIIFGGITTLINITIYWGMVEFFHSTTLLATSIAWIMAVFFAYVSNRRIVFRSKISGIKNICRECATFFSCRLFTGILDMLCMYCFVDLLRFDGVLVKGLVDIFVIFLNYLASKVIIFKSYR